MGCGSAEPAGPGFGTDTDWGGTDDASEPPREDEDDRKDDDADDRTTSDDRDDRDDRDDEPEDDGTTGGEEEEEGSTGADDEAPVECLNMTSCPLAASIGTVSGDSESNPLMLSGEEPTWVTFRVTEDDDDVSGAELSVRLSLQSPADADFDIYTFRGPAGSNTGCNGERSQSTNVSGPEALELAWGEGTFANGQDDTAVIAVEIRPKFDECAPGQQWTLLVEGDI